MLVNNGIKVVFGGIAFMVPSADSSAQWLDLLEKLGIDTIDAAEMYGACEVVLGQAKAASRFALDTKCLGGLAPRPATKEDIVASGKASLFRLGVDQLDVYYVHVPDRRAGWKDMLAGLDALYKQGAFKRLGLSQFTGKEVEEVVQMAKENGFVVPSVYQGNYSAVARRADDELFPVLRKYNIAFYAYSPIAGGFLAKTKASIVGKEDPEGRFGDKNPLAKPYNAMYNRPSFLEALTRWEKIAAAEGVSGAELAYRWVAYHSQLNGDYGDAIVVGARKHSQLEDTVAALKRGPLSSRAVEGIEAIWQIVKKDAFLDNFEMVTAAYAAAAAAAAAK